MVVTKIFINIVCSYFSGSDCTNYSRWTSCTVSTGEYTRDFFYFCVKSGLKDIPFCRDTKLFKWSGYNILSNCDHNNICFEFLFFFCSILWCRSGSAISTDHLWLCDQRFTVTIFIFCNLDRSLQCYKCDSFHNCGFNLGFQGSHVFLTATVNDGYFFCVASDSTSCTVHSNVTTTDNDNIFASVIRKISISNLIQNIYSRYNITGVSTFNTKCLTCLSTNSNKNCIMFLVNIFDRNIFSDCCVVCNMDITAI